MNIRTSDGSRLTRSDRVSLDQELIDVAEKSYSTGEAVTISGYDDEKSVKGVTAKLRTFVNEQNRGLRASAPFQDTDDSWAIEFKVTEKRVLPPRA